MREADAYWRQFIKTGAVQDYLAYVHAREQQIKTKSGEANSVASANGWTGSQRADRGGE